MRKQRGDEVKVCWGGLGRWEGDALLFRDDLQKGTNACLDFRSWGPCVGATCRFRGRAHLDAAADIFFGLVLLDLCLPSSGGIGDGGGVLPV